MLRLALRVFVTCLATATNALYIWPSPPLDALEAMRFDQDRNGITDLIQPCSLFIFAAPGAGRSNAADWIRTAYHDMATHNITDGTGGMDASIRFAEEQARAENVGDGFQNTLAALLGLSTRYISIADVLAAGTIIAFENCGGPEIAFRGGRVDASEPNAPGVPEPQQDLESHTAAFARQGFTQTEMIGLVACGHTFGGVQQALFPQIVPVLNDTNNAQSVSHFDSTFVTFDNNVATEYISGTTQNPLVVGLNDTTNSDKRIFASDGNATMASFASSASLFASTCADLITRMVDTVPAGVQLTDVITPLPVKPDLIDLTLSVDQKTMQFTGMLRVWNLPQTTTHDVRLLWDDRAGGTNNVSLVQSRVATSSGGRATATWFSFPTLTLDVTAGITNMLFAIDNAIEDQGGVGFAIQDDLIWSNTSCITEGATVTGKLAIAVRNDLAPTRVYAESLGRDAVDRPVVVETDFTLQPGAANALYAVWSGAIANGQQDFTIGAEIGGVKVTRNDIRSVFDFSPCAT
ncbi:putative L-ascorbate oxidase [Mycena metata]|uniref:Peroxidase n=1 Tax=Mycena metata TaxID=1033252 RepID=A0AAD7I7K3_9AGAR|nr:putative L-ascorbate oxidase [Mycena metata]